MAKYDRQSMKSELLKRTQESDERKEGESFSKYFKDDVDIILAKFGATKDEPHIIDIIPFMAGDKMPDFMRVKEGKPAYYLDIYVHQNIGPSKTWIICPAKNYGEPCPICEHIEELVKDGKEWEDYSDIAPKRRCVYNIINQSSTKEAKKGIQIWEASHKYSEKPIQAAAKNPRGGGSVPFSHPDKEVGQSISFSVDNDTYKTIAGHKLVPRDYDIEDEILDAAYQLDQILNILTYKEIDRIFNRTKDEPEDENTGNDFEDVKEEKEEKQEKSSRGKKEEKASGCPGVFGEDIDTLDECESCEKYAECANKADEIEAEKKQKRIEQARANRKR